MTSLWIPDLSNAGVADGKLKLKLRRRQNPTTYDGAKITSLWNQVASSEFTQEMVKYGYFEAKIQEMVLYLLRGVHGGLSHLAIH